MGFPEELVKNRKKANLTQEALAEKCDVSRQAVAKWESGESIPDVYKILQIARLFEVSLDELVCGAHQEENQKETAKKIYRLFAQNYESHRIFMKKSAGTIYKVDPSNTDIESLKKLRTLIRQSRMIFSKKIVDELLYLTDEIFEWSSYEKESYKDILKGDTREKVDQYCECIIPEKYDRIELILKDYLDLP